MRSIQPVVTKVIAICLATLALSGCTSCNDQRTRPEGEQRDAVATATLTDAKDAGEVAGASVIREDGRTYTPQTFSFAVTKTDVWIEDAKMGTALDELLAKSGATLAINGGFFDTNEKPLGLAVSQKKPISAFSKTMSGGVLTIDDANATVSATEEYQPDAHADARFAVQCRPRLVVDGKVNIKRDDGKRSARTALCVKDNGKTLNVVLARDVSDPSFGPSLYALATYLAADGCDSALNLDGGPSTGAAWRDASGAHVEKPVGGIRHAILFRPL